MRRGDAGGVTVKRGWRSAGRIQQMSMQRLDFAQDLVRQSTAPSSVIDRQRMRPASNLHRPQRGSTLVIALILLVIVTLFGISAISSSIVNLRISRNVQLAAEAQNAAQRVIDAKISDPATFSSPASSASSVDATGAAATYSVVFDKPSCYSLRPIPGYSYSIAAQAPKNLA